MSLQCLSWNLKSYKTTVERWRGRGIHHKHSLGIVSAREKWYPTVKLTHDSPVAGSCDRTR